MSSSEADDYEVEKVLDMRKHKGVTEYLIRWKNYDPKDDSWEPEKHLTGCKDLLEEFKNSQQKGVNEKKNDVKEWSKPIKTLPYQYSVIAESASKTLEAAEIITRQRVPVAGFRSDKKENGCHVLNQEKKWKLKGVPVLLSLGVLAAALGLSSWYYFWGSPLDVGVF